MTAWCWSGLIGRTVTSTTSILHGDVVAERNAARAFDARPDPERARLGRRHIAPISGKHLERVEVGRPRVGVVGRDLAATDIPARNDDCVADAHAPADPAVLL